MKRVIVFGGSGFLGQHICEELRSQQCDVTAVGLSCDTLHKDIKQICVDIDQQDDVTLQEIIDGHDALVYALGPDDRTTPPKGVSAWEYYAECLAERTKRVATLTCAAGVKKMIVLGSYFTYFNHHGCGDLKAGVLAERHPYIRARQLQYEAVKQIKGLDVATIEIPYVFGSTPGTCSAMQAVFAMYDKSPWLIFGRGGTTAVSVDGVARSVVAALVYGKGGDTFAVGGRNMSYREIFETLLRKSGVKKKFVVLPNWLFATVLHLRRWSERLKGIEAGLDYRYLNHDVLQRNFFVDFAKTNKRLQLTDVDDIDEALVATAKDLK